MNKIKTKFAVLSHILPPSPSGQAVMLYRLLENISPEKYCLISRQNYESNNQNNNASQKLPAKYFHLKLVSDPQKLLYSKLAFFTEPWKILVDIISRTRQIEKILKTEKCQILIVCSGDFLDMLTAYLACFRSKTKLIPYMFDYFTYQFGGIYRKLSRWVETQVVKTASAVIVPNEYLQKEYSKRYHFQSTVIHNPCELPNLDQLDKKKRIFQPSETNIVFTGAIYQAHYDAFRNLIRAIKLIKSRPIKLHIFTAQPITELKREKIYDQFVICHSHVNQLEIADIQRQADILFLPLAFSSPFPEIIKTSAPGKMGEYLAVGKPILAHLPKDSFVSWYLNKFQCGIVVGELSSQKLAQAIENLITNKKLDIGLGKNARDRAEKDFKIDKIRKDFIKLINSIIMR